jgi:cell division protein FtsI/penicillin-binding protein 2
MIQYREIFTCIDSAKGTLVSTDGAKINRDEHLPRLILADEVILIASFVNIKEENNFISVEPKSFDGSLKFRIIGDCDMNNETAIMFSGTYLPEKSELKSNKNLANFAIGQGKLLASPVTLLCLYEAIANGGEYYTPILIEGIMKNAVITEKYSVKSPTKAMDKAKADLLKEYLKEVVKSGTGKGALSENVVVAGKTATAQTGWKDENGEYIEHSWFCGFFPADNPKYVAVVLLENVKNQDTSATEIFKNIAEDLTPNLS